MGSRSGALRRRRCPAMRRHARARPGPPSGGSHCPRTAAQHATSLACPLARVRGCLWRVRSCAASAFGQPPRAAQEGVLVLPSLLCSLHHTVCHGMPSLCILASNSSPLCCAPTWPARMQSCTSAQSCGRTLGRKTWQRLCATLPSGSGGLAGARSHVTSGRAAAATGSSSCACMPPCGAYRTQRLRLSYLAHPQYWYRTSTLPCLLARLFACLPVLTVRVAAHPRLHAKGLHAGLCCSCVCALLAHAWRTTRGGTASSTASRLMVCVQGRPGALHDQLVHQQGPRQSWTENLYVLGQTKVTDHEDPLAPGQEDRVMSRHVGGLGPSFPKVTLVACLPLCANSAVPPSSARYLLTAQSWLKLLDCPGSCAGSPVSAPERWAPSTGRRIGRVLQA